MVAPTVNQTPSQTMRCGATSKNCAATGWRINHEDAFDHRLTLPIKVKRPSPTKSSVRCQPVDIGGSSIKVLACGRAPAA